jgi:AcrR family transcriptional regulator
MRDLGPVPPPLPGSEAPVTGGLRERKKRLMRQQLSDTATRMFLERGFDAVKVTEIAEACGVSEKTVFNYFPTRRFGALIWQTPSLRAYQSDTMDQATAMVAGILAGRSGLRPDDPEPQIAAAALLGQSIQAVGGNAEAARLSGIRVDRVRITAFVIAGVCAGVTGILLTSLTGSGAVDGGDSYLLSAFAASFFGSAVLRDGQFHIVGTMLGVLTVSVGFNAMALLGLNTYYQYLFQGALLIFAVGVGSLARRRVTR